MKKISTPGYSHPMPKCIPYQYSDEARIAINGILLSQSQSRTIRVAVEELAAFLTNNGLGDDEIGKIKTGDYLKDIRSIRNLLYAA